MNNKIPIRFANAVSKLQAREKEQEKLIELVPFLQGYALTQDVFHMIMANIAVAPYLLAYRRVCSKWKLEIEKHVLKKSMMIDCVRRAVPTENHNWVPLPFGVAVFNKLARLTPNAKRIRMEACDVAQGLPLLVKHVRQLESLEIVGTSREGSFFATLSCLPATIRKLSFVGVELAGYNMGFAENISKKVKKVNATVQISCKYCNMQEKEYQEIAKFFPVNFVPKDDQDVDLLKCLISDENVPLRYVTFYNGLTPLAHSIISERVELYKFVFPLSMPNVDDAASCIGFDQDRVIEVLERVASTCSLLVPLHYKPTETLLTIAASKPYNQVSKVITELLKYSGNNYSAWLVNGTVTPIHVAIKHENLPFLNMICPLIGPLVCAGNEAAFIQGPKNAFLPMHLAATTNKDNVRKFVANLIVA